MENIVIESTLPVKLGFLFVRIFRFGRKKTIPNREAIGTGREPVYNEKEVPLDARKNHSEMQRVQAEKLQHYQEQEERS